MQNQVTESITSTASYQAKKFVPVWYPGSHHIELKEQAPMKLTDETLKSHIYRRYVFIYQK